MRRLLAILAVTVAAAAVAFGSYELGMTLRPATVEYVTPAGRPTQP